MSQLCAGWDVATVREIVADTLHNIVDPLVYDEAVSLIEEHHLAGRDVVIVSTSRRRGGRADRRDARRRPGGRHPDGDRRRASTPARSSYYAYAEEKARAIRDARRRSAATTSTRCYAYSDSVTDVHMLEAVGHPHAVNPDKELRRIAAAQRLAGPGLHQAGRAAHPGAAARRPSRPSPRSRSAASWPSAACCGRTPAGAASAPERGTHQPAEMSTLEVSRRDGVQTRAHNSKTRT